MIQKKVLSQIVSIQKKRFRKAFGKGMDEKQVSDLQAKFRNAFNEKQMSFYEDEQGKLVYFFQFQLTLMHEFNEQFFYVPVLWCKEDVSARKMLLKAIRSEARKSKREKKVQKMLVAVSPEEASLLSHFKKAGRLTYIELVGKTSESLGRLAKESMPRGVSFSRLKPVDVPVLVKLDLESHLKDPSSRMHEIFAKPIASKLMKNFYRNLVKSKKCFVLKKDGKIAGSIAWFIDKKNHYGLVASIFVAENFKGQGLSKIMYKKLLEEFQRKKCPYYIGSSTTERVLILARKMKRKPMNYCYIIRIS